MLVQVLVLVLVLVRVLVLVTQLCDVFSTTWAWQCGAMPPPSTDPVTRRTHEDAQPRAQPPQTTVPSLG